MMSNKVRTWIPFVFVLALIILSSSIPPATSAMDRAQILQRGSAAPTHIPPTDRTSANAPTRTSELTSDDLSVVGHWGVGPGYALATNGTNRLYAANGRRLDIYDTTVGDSPALLGSLVVPAAMTNIVADGSTLFVGTYRGFVTVDISNPAAPAQTGHYLEDCIVNCFWLEGDMVFLTAAPGGVYQFVRNPNSTLSEVDALDPGGACSGLMVADSILTVGRTDGDAISMSLDPLAIEGELSQIPNANFFTVEGDVLYVSSSEGLLALDMADATAPALMSSCPMGELFINVIHNNVALYGDYAYHMMWGYGLLVADISDPFDFACGEPYETDGNPYIAVVLGSYLYTVTNSGGLQTYDLAVPAAPELVDSQQVHSYAAGLLFVDDYLLVSQNYVGIKTLDLSDPTQPVEVGVFQDEWAMNEMRLVGNTIFALNQYNPGFLALDATDPTALAVIDTFHFEQSTSLYVEGDVAYVTLWPDGLTLLDISDPANLAQLGFLPDCVPYGMVKVGDLLYVCEDTDLNVVDVSDPTNPSIVGTAGENVGEPVSVCYVAPYLIVADYTLGAVVLDISTTPLAPSLVTTFAEDYAPLLGINVTENFLCLSGSDTSFSLWDIDDPANPVQLGEAPKVGFWGYQMVSRANLIYGSEGESGVVVMENEAMVPVHMPSASAAWQGLDVNVTWQVNNQIPGPGFVVWREAAGSGRIPVSPVLTSQDGHFVFIDSAAPVIDTSTRYWLQELVTHGAEIWYGPLDLNGQPDLPTHPVLRANIPNPFNPRTTIEYTLPATQKVSIKVYDMAGRRISTLFEGENPAGLNQVIWDGTHDGAAMPSGVYLVRLVTESGVDSRKIVLAR